MDFSRMLLIPRARLLFVLFDILSMLCSMLLVNWGENYRILFEEKIYLKYRNICFFLFICIGGEEMEKIFLRANFRRIRSFGDKFIYFFPSFLSFFLYPCFDGKSVSREIFHSSNFSAFSRTSFLLFSLQFPRLRSSSSSSSPR